MVEYENPKGLRVWGWLEKQRVSRVLRKEKKGEHRDMGPSWS